ncbi:hypothetical protein GCM10018785_56230 [Streptomyces longispororuber]|uniref:Uncharacterized protein n=1 Tax=Streptomyces longispororuber TaxID=68230 RepID=A0A919DSS6_9ACTN|nr:hypothetical protein GCM10018785_56230 [Streptomyces longispororuber]
MAPGPGLSPAHRAPPRPGRGGGEGPVRGVPAPPVNLGGVDPKTRNRIMAGVLVLMFVVVALAAALGK